MSDTDLELLAQYTRHHAEDAFAEIVQRYLGLVHSAALRQVRSPQLAEEVAQSTFINLARHASRLAPDTILAAWLYQVARRESIDVVRREARRQLREQIATEMNAMHATAAAWTHIEPLLDEAMHALDETDRAAVLLRYFENKSLREVGATLGTTENAAQKRLGRAIERLREYLAKRGVTVGASGLAVIISGNVVHAAPVGLAVTISTAVASAGTAAPLTSSTLFSMKLLNAKSAAAIIGAFLIGSGAYSVWHDKARAFRVEPDRVATQPLTTDETLYREMLAAYPIAGEVAEGHPTRALWEDRKVALLQANYIETRDIPLPKVFPAKGDVRTFFDRFQKRFLGLELGLRGVNRETPPIAYVTARKTDLGPTGVVEQFIRNYDPEKP